MRMRAAPEKLVKLYKPPTAKY